MRCLVIKTFCGGENTDIPGAALAFHGVNLNTDYVVFVIYMDFKKQSEIVPKILNLKTQSFYGQNINLDGLLIQPSIQNGLSALIITKAQKVKLVDAASLVPKTKLTMAHGACLQDISSFLEAHNEQPFIGDHLVSNRLKYIAMDCNDKQSLYAHLGKKLYVTNYLGASGSIGKILTSLNW